MWMIHTWLFFYLFRDEIYGMGNSLLMYLTVVLLSYIISKMFSVVIQPLLKFVFK